MTQMILWIVLAVLVAAVGGAILIYHSLVQLRLRCQELWSQLTDLLRTRLALVPHLVDAASRQAAHESDVLKELEAARQAASAASGVRDRGAAEVRLAGALKRLFDLQRLYPGLRANVDFARLREELITCSNRIRLAAEQYNAQVDAYNALRKQAFHRQVAAVLKMRPLEPFPAAAAEVGA